MATQARPAGPPFAARVGSLDWVLTLAALTAITALSIDSSLPAQPELARVFGASPAVVQLTLSVFLVGFAGGQLLVGPLSDAWGRRPVLLAGMAAYAAAGLACSLAGSIGWLIALRFAQGASASAGPVLARAMVRDTQPTAHAARLLSSMVAVLALAPMVAPSLGAALLSFLGWRWIFGALAALGVAFALLSALRLPETLPPERRRPLGAAHVAGAFARFLRAPGTLRPTLLACAAFGGQFAYISDSPFVLIDGYGIGPARYGLYFALTALALMAGSMAGVRLLRFRPPRRMLRLGGAIVAAGALLVALGTRFPALGIAGFVAPMMIYFAGIGLTNPSATALAMEQVPEIAGTASAAVGFLTTVSGAAAGSLATQLAGSEAPALGAVVGVLGAISLALALAAAREPR